MQTIPYTAPAEVQPKTIEQKIAEERERDQFLYREYCRLKEANEPTKRAMEETGNIWCDCRRRIEVLELMKKEMAQ